MFQGLGFKSQGEQPKKKNYHLHIGDCKFQIIHKSFICFGHRHVITAEEWEKCSREWENSPYYEIRPGDAPISDSLHVT
jgi:hypothetical protein